MKKSLLLVIIFLVPFVSAEILVGQTESVYSYGDDVSLDITLRPSSQTNSFLIIDLVCDSRTEINRQPLNLAANEERVVTFNTKFEDEISSGLIGDCYFGIEYGSEIKQSSNFLLSKDIEVVLDFDRVERLPGERVVIQGVANKENGESLNGFVNVSLNGVNVSANGVVSSGSFTVNFTLPQNAPSGERDLVVNVYDKSLSGDVLNYASVVEDLAIQEVPKRIEITTESESIYPNETLSYGIKVFDQSSKEIEKEVVLSIFSPTGEERGSEVIDSGQGVFEPVDSYAPGYWKLEASLGDLKGRKLFYIEEFENVDFVLEENTLVVNNVGNVRYDKPVEIQIGNQSRIVDLDLGVGESKSFNLFAPDNEYEINVKVGEEVVTPGTAFLTGRAVSIDEVGGSILGGNFFWILFVALGIMALAVGVRRVIRKKGQSLIAPKKEVKVASGVSVSGKKEGATVVAVNVKDKVLGERVVNILGGKVYENSDHKIVVFSGKDGFDIVKKADDIKKELKDKEFGIGISMGEAIFESNGKVTPMGNLVSVAKNLASSSKGEIYASRKFRYAVPKTIKFDKVNDNSWKVTDFSDKRDRHLGFIENFKKKHQ